MYTSIHSLAEVAQLAAAGDSFDRCLANFLDDFYAHPSAGKLAEAPPILAQAPEDFGHLCDAYLAATAEELARQYDFPPPPWMFEEARKLHRPWFAMPHAGMRAVLLHESPPGFRSRNIFVSENALSRA